ncbi:MAG: hypothetical protein LBQ59_05045 [Candidatus Peribacteria bacterium]|jgi:hypothetical protein|nr:hypothetical protein [Candidatus Peribacteria bacterium]
MIICFEFIYTFSTFQSPKSIIAGKLFTSDILSIENSDNAGVSGTGAKGISHEFDSGVPALSSEDVQSQEVSQVGGLLSSCEFLSEGTSITLT